MSVLLGNIVLDNGLTYLQSKANRIALCSAQPTSFANVAVVQLGSATFGAGGVFTGPTAGAPNGRQVTSVAITNGTVSQGGTATYIAVVDDINAGLLVTAPVNTPLAVAISNAWQLASFTVTIGSGATLMLSALSLTAGAPVLGKPLLTALLPPVVNAGTFSATEPVLAGSQTPPWQMAFSGGAPTAWSINTGNGLGYFAINSVTGEITVTAAGAAGLTTAQNFSLGVQATNAAGTGLGTASLTISAASGFNDGLAGAPAGVPAQFPNALTRYGAHRPPWNVAGVEYGVGITPNVTLTLANPCVCTWANHGLVAGRRLAFYTYGTLPSGIPTSTILPTSTPTAVFVIAAGLTTNTFQISLTSGGSAISTLGQSQSGAHFCLKNPSDTLPSGISISGNSIQVGSGAVLDHYDCTSGSSFLMPNVVGTNGTITNCYIKNTGTGQNGGGCSGATGTIIFSNNIIDGQAIQGNTVGEQISFIPSNGGNITAQYNWAYNIVNDFVNYACSSISVNTTMVFKYNLQSSFPIASGHADLLQIQSGTYNAFTLTFNTTLAYGAAGSPPLGQTPQAPNGGSQGWQLEGNAGSTTVNGPALIANNTCSCPFVPVAGGTAINFFTGCTSGTATGQPITVSNNYLDLNYGLSGAGNLVRSAGNNVLVTPNNINMITGAVQNN